MRSEFTRGFPPEGFFPGEREFYGRLSLRIKFPGENF